jgi:hypothetical protein
VIDVPLRYVGDNCFECGKVRMNVGDESVSHVVKDRASSSLQTQDTQ